MTSSTGIRGLLFLALAPACTGCGVTELVVVVDTDMTVPAELDRIELIVTGPGREVRIPLELAMSGQRLPAYASFTPGSDGLEPVDVVAIGRSGGAEVVRRRVSTGFVDGQSRLVTIQLLGRCAGLDCETDPTCEPAECRPATIPGESLPSFVGVPPKLAPAMTDAAPPCTADTDNDPLNCGACGVVCDDGPNATTVATCTGGVCGLRCADDRGDCNSDLTTDGCERDLASDTQACGACDVSCRDGFTCADAICEEHLATAIDSGASHVCVAFATGRIACWGLCTSGQTGTACPGRAVGVTLLTEVSDVVELSTGRLHTCARLSDGQVRCWGDNQFYQLGATSPATSRSPVTPVAGPASAIAAGDNHVCIVRSDTTVACWGSNSDGQLGDTTPDVRSATPVDVPGLVDVVALAAGGQHSCARTAEGDLHCWGQNDVGQLGAMTDPDLATPVATSVSAVTAGSRHTCILVDEMVSCAGLLEQSMPDGFELQLRIHGAPDRSVQSIASGANHACGIVGATGSDEGLVICWGANDEEQLGYGANLVSGPFNAVDLEPIGGFRFASDTAPGLDHTCVLRAVDPRRARVDCWGDGSDGQIPGLPQSRAPVTVFP